MRLRLSWFTVLVGLAIAALPVAPFPVHRAVSVDTLIVSPHADTGLLRTSLTLTAHLADSLGRAPGNVVTWTSRDTAVVRVRSTKKSGNTATATLRLGADTGRTYVVAAAGGKKDSGLIVVQDTVCSEVTVASINLYPDSATAHRTDTLAAVALPKNQCGHFRSYNLTWISSDSTKATVTRLDSLVARIQVLDSGPGSVYIKGVSGTKRDSMKVKYKHAP